MKDVIELLKQIQYAMNFAGQAQELAPAGSHLWKELGGVFDTLDSLQDAINSNEIDDNGNPL